MSSKASEQSLHLIKAYCFTSSILILQSALYNFFFPKWTSSTTALFFLKSSASCPLSPLVIILKDLGHFFESSLAFCLTPASFLGFVTLKHGQGHRVAQQNQVFSSYLFLAAWHNACYINNLTLGGPSLTM